MKLRRLTRGEQALALEVFGDALDPAKVALITHAPTGGWAIALFGLILFPCKIADFAEEPAELQAWFVHELVHAWQFQSRPLWSLMSWAKLALGGGYHRRRGYTYALPIYWERLNLEQQAKTVEHRFLLKRGRTSADMPRGATLEAYADQIKSRRYAASGASAGGIG